MATSRSSCPPAMASTATTASSTATTWTARSRRRGTAPHCRCSSTRTCSISSPTRGTHRAVPRPEPAVHPGQRRPPLVPLPRAPLRTPPALRAREVRPRLPQRHLRWRRFGDRLGDQGAPCRAAPPGPRGRHLRDLHERKRLPRPGGRQQRSVAGCEGADVGGGCASRSSCAGLVGSQRTRQCTRRHRFGPLPDPGFDRGRTDTSDRALDGRDITPLLLGTTDGSPHEAFLYYRGNDLEAFRSGRWKLYVAGGASPSRSSTTSKRIRGS